MAIAWMYREDYACARYLVLPAKNGYRFLVWLTGPPSFALFIASLAAAAANSGALLYFSATVILGSGLFYYATRQVYLRSRIAARKLLKASIVYLPLPFLILVLGKG